MKNRKLAIGIAVLLVAYIGSYLYLSRQAYSDARRSRASGFYYFEPKNTDLWHFRNFGCVVLYCPLNWVDRTLGFGQASARAPLMDLGKRRDESGVATDAGRK